MHIGRNSGFESHVVDLGPTIVQVGNAGIDCQFACALVGQNVQYIAFDRFFKFETHCFCCAIHPGYLHVGAIFKNTFVLAFPNAFEQLAFGGYVSVRVQQQHF